MTNKKLNSIFKTVCIASDHAGFHLKENIKDHLINKKISIFDIGPYTDKSVDYPDYAKKLGNRIKLTKKKLSLKLVELFLMTKFEGGRHLRRVKKI